MSPARPSLDGDGTRVAQLYTPYDENGQPQTDIITTYFMGGAYEVTETLDGTTFTQSGIRKYYSIAGMTVAENTWNVTPGTWNLSYLLTDHLGSVVAITDSNGTLTSQQRYLPFGQVRTDLNGPRITQTDFGYTGQRAIEGLGLMDYKARFYDSLLGRFISPDTIIPSAASPQSWSRFSYVNNSPINFNDPSGHICASLANYRGRTLRDDECEAGRVVTPPTLLDRKKLTITSSVTGIGGSQLYDLYIQLWSRPSGWWWNSYGRDGNFSIWDFMSLTSYYEAGGLTQYSSTLAEAGVRWYYGGGCYGNPNQCGSAENILNWWAAYSQSAAGMYDLVIKQNKTPEQIVGKNPGDMSIFGNSFQNPSKDWQQGWASDHPYGWANTGFGIWTPNALRMFAKYPLALFVQYDTFIIPSGCAWSNWQNLGNQAYCPPVR